MSVFRVSFILAISAFFFFLIRWALGRCAAVFLVLGYWGSRRKMRATVFCFYFIILFLIAH